MIMLRLQTALDLGYNVGADERCAMTSGGVVFVHETAWDERASRIADVMVDREGDGLHIPPFEWRCGELSGPKK